ncbi:hypothetical protein BGP77_00805 [Saccharospirillum sp. MSK14-1]|uniref:hypothetical protein n=1 Tax=Saccharospirillum sp. MSK14-1 TaxID=1897632 RepID=UPI000D3652DB|nr:hypothetical protein [Saccharospirillum sp. MSK14-1]PTY35900.1 hypothetical protein BGP77_00805 [Saccharospirillum sp. MSK14-1]
MFIDGLTEHEKHQLAIHLREHDHTPFMVIKHAHAASQCEKRGIEVHPIDRKYLNLLDEAIASLYEKYRQGPGLSYSIHQSTRRGLA